MYFSAVFIGDGSLVAVQQYRCWPFAAYKLCRKFNPHGYIYAAMEFLQMPDELLDEGFGLPLRKLAFKMGKTENQRIQYLLSEAVHQSIVLAFAVSYTHLTLPTILPV